MKMVARTDSVPRAGDGSQCVPGARFTDQLYATTLPPGLGSLLPVPSKTSGRCVTRPVPGRSVKAAMGRLPATQAPRTHFTPAGQSDPSLQAIGRSAFEQEASG